MMKQEAWNAIQADAKKASKLLIEAANANEWMQPNGYMQYVLEFTIANVMISMGVKQSQDEGATPIGEYVDAMAANLKLIIADAQTVN